MDETLKPQMCYWRRLSKRSVDNNDFEYTDERAALGGNVSNSDANSLATQQPPIISDSLSLFKALQVRHEPAEPSKARRRAQRMQEIYAEDEEAQLVCYRHAEVLVFMTTTGSLLLLVLTIAITCCFRIRKLTRGQFKHNRVPHHNSRQSGSSLVSQSLSPSLLSISDALSQVMGPASALAGQQSQHMCSGQATLNHEPPPHQMVLVSSSRRSSPVSPSVSFFRSSLGQAPMKPIQQQAAASLCYQQQKHRQQQHLSPRNSGRASNSFATSADTYSLDR